jgi:LL-diaminopimelate aminotransferase
MKRAQRLIKSASYPFAEWSKHIDAATKRGMDVIRLDIGNPEMAPPDDVIDALKRSAGNTSHHGYPGYRGVPALRDGIADYYHRRFGVRLDASSQVVPLIGSKEGIVNIAQACVDPGDIVLVPDPGYAAYTLGGYLAGADVRTFPLIPECGYLPDLDAIPPDVADSAVMLWLNYPNNPTGATADLGFFEEAVQFARRHDLLLCHDAPYSDVTYDGYAAPSILEVNGASDVAIEFNSLSKTWNMAGWRIGMAVGNADALTALGQVKSNFDSGVFRPVQDAAVRALSMDPDWISDRNRIYKNRLDIVLDALNAVGIETTRPSATLYLWVQIPDQFVPAKQATYTESIETGSSEAFALSLLEKTGVALAPGSFFGPAGEGFVRISITAPTDRVQEAMRRLVSYSAG